MPEIIGPRTYLEDANTLRPASDFPSELEVLGKSVANDDIFKSYWIPLVAIQILPFVRQIAANSDLFVRLIAPVIILLLLAALFYWFSSLDRTETVSTGEAIVSGLVMLFMLSNVSPDYQFGLGILLALGVAVYFSDSLNYLAMKHFICVDQKAPPELQVDLQQCWNRRFHNRQYWMPILDVVLACGAALVFYLLLTKFCYFLVPVAAGYSILLLMAITVLFACRRLYLERQLHHSQQIDSNSILSEFLRLTQFSIVYRPHPYAPGVFRPTHQSNKLFSRPPWAMMVTLFAITIVPAAHYFPYPLMFSSAKGVERIAHAIELSSTPTKDELATAFLQQRPTFNDLPYQQQTTYVEHHYSEFRKAAFADAVNESPEAWMFIAHRSGAIHPLAIATGIVTAIIPVTIICFSIIYTLTAPTILEIYALRNSNNGVIDGSFRTISS